MSRAKHIVLSSLATLIFGLATHADSSTPSISIAKVGDTPDLMQSLAAADLPDAGAAYCGPVAISNSLIWLGRNGYERLAPPSQSTPSAQGALARLLGEPRYMGTTYQEGTSVDGVLQGLARFMADRRYDFQYLGYQGWDVSASPYSTGIKVPNLEWIQAGLDGDAAVWLKIGWYRRLASTTEWQKFAGHWVTLVGYGVNENGERDPSVLIVHDPAPRSGEQASSDYVKVIPLPEGALRSSSGRRTISAQGFYQLTGGLKIKQGADLGVLDAAVVLRMK